MKANELMIGDWVYDTLSQTDIKVNRGCFETNLLNGICYAENLIPIPLTAEILEKNGFKHNEIWHNSFQDIDNYHINILFGYGGKVDSVRITELGEDRVIPSEKTTMYLTHIQYVNELQHALRLCGIEKNIEL